MLFQRIPWRQRQFLSIRDVADILALSPLWVKQEIKSGRLKTHKISSGPPVIAVSSVLALVDELTPRADVDTPRGPRPRPELVVDNTR